MLEKVEFKKLREFGEIINDTFLFIKQNFKPLLKVYIYLCGFFLLAGAIASVMQQLGMKKMMFGSNPGSPFSSYQISELFTVNYFLVILFSMASYTAINVSILGFIAAYMEKGKVAPTPEEVWVYFKYYFFRVFWSSLLMSLFLIFCFALCLIPGIYVFPAISLFSSIMVLENKKLGYSFDRSFKLLKEQWWVTAGAVLVIWVITYACMSLASLPAVALTMVGVFTQGSKGLTDTVVIIATVIQQLCYVFMIIPVIGCTLCYFNLAERQESAGLMDRISEMGQKKDDFNGIEEY
jgi:hypothetical protein